MRLPLTKRLPAGFPPVLLLCLTCIFFAIRIWHGLWLGEFVDESEHLLDGMMLDRGAILYRTVIPSHGPLTFMFTQAYGAAFGWSNPNDARLISAALALCAGICIATSPAVPGLVAKLWAAALFFGLLATVWLLQALFMVNYHAIAGFFMVMGLALFVVPVWLNDQLPRWRAALAGLCLILVIATAYSFAPAAILLSASAMWASWTARTRHLITAFLAGGAAAFLAMLVWLLWFGDLIGYLVFHFLINQFIYAKYIPLSVTWFLQSLVPSAQPMALVHSLALLSWATALVLLLLMNAWRSQARRMMGPILLGLAALLALCVRGGTIFQDGSFVIAAIGMLSIVLPAAAAPLLAGRFLPPQTISAAGSLAILLGIAGTELVMRHAISSPHRLTRAELVAQPRHSLGVSDEPLYMRIRAITAPSDRILAVPYAPAILLSAGRMPMDKYTVYLPWDAEYAKNPWFGRDRDLCADMAKSPPKLVYFNNWIVWNRWSMAEYAPCFIKILNDHYERQTDFPDLYLRRDSPP